MSALILICRCIMCISVTIIFFGVAGEYKEEFKKALAYWRNRKQSK